MSKKRKTRRVKASDVGLSRRELRRLDGGKHMCRNRAAVYHVTGLRLVPEQSFDSPGGT